MDSYEDMCEWHFEKSSYYKDLWGVMESYGDMDLMPRITTPNFIFPNSPFIAWIFSAVRCRIMPSLSRTAGSRRFASSNLQNAFLPLLSGKQRPACFSIIAHGSCFLNTDSRVGLRISSFRRRAHPKKRHPERSFRMPLTVRIAFHQDRHDVGCIPSEMLSVPLLCGRSWSFTGRRRQPNAPPHQPAPRRPRRTPPRSGSAG